MLSVKAAAPWALAWWRKLLSNVCCRGIAQLAERRSPKPKVGGSIPSAPAIYRFNPPFVAGFRVWVTHFVLRRLRMSNTQAETLHSGADKLKIAFAILFIVAGVVAYYFLAAKGGAFQWGALIALLTLAVAVFLWSGLGRGLIGFGRDSWREAQKVVWPTRKEAAQTTIFVFAFSVVLALFLWSADKTIEWVMYDLILGWKK